MDRDFGSRYWKVEFLRDWNYFLIGNIIWGSHLSGQVLSIMYHRHSAEAWAFVSTQHEQNSVSKKCSFVPCISIPWGFFLNTSVKNCCCGCVCSEEQKAWFLTGIWCFSLFMPCKCIKTFPIDCAVGLICGFHLLAGFFKFIWPSVLLLNLAKNQCLLVFYIWFDIYCCVCYFACDSRLHMRSVTFHFFISMLLRKGAYTYR